MDKKKVIELIKKGISYWNRSSYITSYEDDAKECFNEAIKELSKSDWISVEDRLPEYDERVLVYSKYKELYWISHRMKDVRIRKDHNGFIHPLKDCAITHWKPIEKLEE
jgi:hypothetical protein